MLLAAVIHGSFPRKPSLLRPFELQTYRCTKLVTVTQKLLLSATFWLYRQDLRAHLQLAAASHVTSVPDNRIDLQSAQNCNLSRFQAQCCYSGAASPGQSRHLGRRALPVSVSYFRVMRSARHRTVMEESTDLCPRRISFVSEG